MLFGLSVGHTPQVLGSKACVQNGDSGSHTDAIYKLVVHK